MLVVVYYPIFEEPLLSVHHLKNVLKMKSGVFVLQPVVQIVSSHLLSVPSGQMYAILAALAKKASSEVLIKNVTQSECAQPKNVAKMKNGNSVLDANQHAKNHSLSAAKNANNQLVNA